MSIDRQQLEADILQFVKSRAPAHPSLGLETDLLEEGVLDSLLLVDLIFHLEERYGLKLGSEHIDPANFRSPAAIVNLIVDQTGSRSSAA
ncbi:MAG: acyl carrier protein [Xanthobacteraceae bacterium]|nr:acyl carrier protein [Xanthobacteraceae bacterium]